jgi:hypothetical protein
LDKDGKIVGVDLKTYDSNNGTLKENKNTTTSIDRTGDNKFEFMQPRDDGIRTIVGEFSIETYGRNYDLKYSDFGRLLAQTTTKYNDNTPDEVDEPSYEPFAGGYEVMKISKDKLSDEMDFTGKAVGYAQYHSGNNGKDSHELIGVATLNFKNGTETLNMDFSESDWYDVEIVKNGNNANIAFSNGDRITNDNFKFSGGNEHSATDYLSGDYNGKIDNDNNGEFGKIEIDYYGNSGNPSEFGGVTQYVENELRMNVAFGGARD